MQILHPFTGSVQQYCREVSDPDRFRPDHCPQCEAHRPLAAHGFYSRTLVDVEFDELDPHTPVPVPLLPAHGIATAGVCFAVSAFQDRGDRAVS